MTGDGGAVEIALLDRAGVIESVNQAWTDFCLDNGGDPSRTGIGVSYLGACGSAADDEAAGRVRAAIESALAGQLVPPVVVQIPCDSPTEPRWFDVLVSSRFDAGDGRCIGASVTLTRSQASRKPAADLTSSTGQSPPAYPDLARLELEWLVGEVIERCNEVFTRHERLREDAERWRRWTSATIEACRGVLAEGCERPFDVVTRSVVEAGAGAFAFVATRTASVVAIDAASWSPDERPDEGVLEALGPTVAESVVQGAAAMLVMDGSMAVSPPLVGNRGPAALIIGSRGGRSQFDSTDLAALAVFVFHVATAVALARARVIPPD